MKKFDIRLKRLREDIRLTQEQARRALGVSQATLSKWETGVRYPSLLDLKNICLAYAVSMDYLFFGNNNSGVEYIAHIDQSPPKLAPEIEELVLVSQRLRRAERLKLVEYLQIRLNSRKKK